MREDVARRDAIYAPPSSAYGVWWWVRGMSSVVDRRGKVNDDDDDRYMSSPKKNGRIGR